MTWNPYSKAIKNSMVFYNQGETQKHKKCFLNRIISRISSSENLITLNHKIQIIPEKPEFLALVLPVPIHRLSLRSHIANKFSQEHSHCPMRNIQIRSYS